MEGIGLAASIVGLLAAGGKMIPWLFNLKNGLTDAPDSIRTVWTELTETSLILKEIQLYILQVHPTTSNRRSLILIDHISVTLTGCIVTYSDLERQIDFTRASENIDHMSIFERGKWLLKEKEILDIIRRLQNHKSSLALMLNIMQCHSMQKAQETLQNLCRAVERNLTEDNPLRTQLGSHAPVIADSVSYLARESILEHDAASSFLPDADGISAVTSRQKLGFNQPIYESQSVTIGGQIGPKLKRLSLNSVVPWRRIRSSKTPRVFEEQLKSSWVYKRSGISWSNPSLQSCNDSERGMALSTISRLSVSQVSNISVYALPIHESEVYNADWYNAAPDQLGTRQSYNVSTTIPHSLISECIQQEWTFGTAPSGDTTDSEPIFSFFPKYLPRNPCFYGREDAFQILSEAVSKRDTTTGASVRPPFILWGPPGRGKTETALEFFYRFEYPSTLDSSATLRPDYRIWIHADTEENLVRGFAEFFRNLWVSQEGQDGPSVKSAQADSELAQAYSLCLWLEQTDAKWLLVLDNVVEVDKISKLCPRRALNGNVIIITRESSVHRYRNITDQSAGPVLEYELPSLNEADAIALIQASFPYITFDDKVNNACSELIERVGRLPVGIQAIMNLIKEQGGGLQGQEKLSSTAAVLKNCKIRHGYRLESYSDTDPNDLLHKIWAHELERLKLREDAYRDDKVEASTAGASNILDIVAFLDPETITEAHIQSILSYQVMLIQRHKMVPSREANFLEAAGLASLRPLLVNPPDLKARYQIDKLARYSRIIEMPVAKRRGIMDMISGWFLQFRSEEPGTMDQTQDSTVPKAVTSAVRRTHSTLSPNEYIRHLDFLRQIAIEFLIDVDPNGESFGLPILFLTALRNGCRVFSNQIQYETIDPVKTWIIARKFLETLALVTDHPNCDQMVLSGDRKDPGEVNLEIVECLFMQAREAMMSGSLQAALELLERCKVYYERYFYLEPDRIGTDQSGTQKSGISGLDLTQMFSRLKSDNLETRSLQDIQYALRGYSKCDIQIITALTRLGKIDVPETASRLSMYVARELGERVGGVRKSIGNNPRALDVLLHPMSELPHAQYSLGNICLKEEKYDEALCLHKNSLSLFSRMYGEEHYLTAAASAQLGMSCIRQDRYSEGIYYLERAASIFASKKPDIWGLKHRTRIAVLLEQAYTQVLEIKNADVQRAEQRSLAAVVDGGLPPMVQCMRMEKTATGEVYIAYGMLLEFWQLGWPSWDATIN